MNRSATVKRDRGRAQQIVYATESSELRFVISGLRDAMEMVTNGFPEPLQQRRVWSGEIKK
jgi:hypothetical protein